MLTQPKRFVGSSRGLLSAVCLGLVSIALLGAVQQAWANPANQASATAKVAPSGSQPSAGVHGRVYALDKSGKIIGTVTGAKIELKSQAGAVVATITSVKNGYYKADLPAGQYFYKVTATGYKDEDEGRGFTLQRSDEGHLYDFWLVKGPNDPDKKPPEIPRVEISKLKGHVWEKTAEGQLIGIPKAAISLRRNGTATLTKVFTRGAGKDSKKNGFYEVVLQTGSWRASVQAPGFKLLVDPKPIAIQAGKETTRDFILQRHIQRPPTNQGIKGIVRVRDSRLGHFPTDLKVELKPVNVAMNVDSGGGFRQELQPGSYRVQASAKGYRTADSGQKFVFAGKYTMVELLLVPEQVPETTPEDTDKPDDMDRPGQMRLVLTVVEESQRGRRPLPGAKLLVRRSNQGLAEAQRGETDETGKADFPLKQSGPYVALARAEGFQPAGIKLEVTPGADLSRTITLHRHETEPPIEPGPGPQEPGTEEAEPVKVAGYVIRNDKKSPTGAFGVADTHLTWQRIGKRGERFQRVSTGRTGNFDLVLPEGDYRVGLDLPEGYQPKEPEMVQVRVGMGKKWFIVAKASEERPDTDRPEMDYPEDQQQEVDVRGAVVVQSARGRGGYAGVSNAMVQWHPQEGTHARPKTIRSSRGGAFSLRLGPGVYTAEVVPPAGYQHTTKTVHVHPEMQRTLLVLNREREEMPGTMPGGLPGTIPGIIPGGIKPPTRPGNLTLTLQVHGRDRGRTFPLGAAKIYIHGQRQQFMTDKGGRLSVPLPPGNYIVMVTKQGYNVAHRQVVLSRQNQVAPTIYLDRQPSGGGSEITPPGEGTTPPLQQTIPLQLRVMVSFPKPAKQGQPAGWTTTPAKGATIRILHGKRQVFSGRADNNGYLGTRLGSGSYQIQVSHGNLRQNEPLNMGGPVVRKTITLQSGAAIMTPMPGPIRIMPGQQNNRNQIIPGVQQIQNIVH